MKLHEHIEQAAGDLAYTLSQFGPDRRLNRYGRREIALELGDIFILCHLPKMGPKFAHLLEPAAEIVRGASFWESDRLYSAVVDLLLEFDRTWRIPKWLMEIWKCYHPQAVMELQAGRSQAA